MKFVADLHIHSKFSRATAKNLDFENLYTAAQLKGITVVGTGDFTHPGWFMEIRNKLVPSENGLFKLKDEIAAKCDEKVPYSCRACVRFILQTEVSTIYKKAGRTRKNHNLVFMPDLSSAAALNSKLNRLGNIKSDGRPILGLDAKNLLELVLETSDQAFLIPAHIWTPWFSVLGSKSGFDSIEECFEDLSSYIFAAETGLSSDPAMNWRVSSLDGVTLVSNSDAHSPRNLGREANLFHTILSYAEIKSAIQSGDPERFLGTFEFYPEEGKYHLDGHRKCNICFRPEKSLAHRGICPVCGKPLTLGVLYRVEELADRKEGKKPDKTYPFYSMVPLAEILSEIFQMGPNSKRINQSYRKALEMLGPELNILHTLLKNVIDKAGIPLLSEAVGRTREKKLHIFPGYDGEYGRIQIFENDEREKLRGQQSLFVIPSEGRIQKERAGEKYGRLNISGQTNRKQKAPSNDNVDIKSNQPDIRNGLNEAQREAVEHEKGPLLIIAGPGTGKTRTLIHRIALLVKDKKVPPEYILAVTFTNKAAREMHDRLHLLMNGSKSTPLVTTFHSLGFKILKNEKNEADYRIMDDEERKFMISEAVKHLEKNDPHLSIKSSILSDWILSAKQQIIDPDDHFADVVKESEKKVFYIAYRFYQNLLSMQRLYDYEDLIFKTVKLLESDERIRQKYQELFKYILVDEYQDLNHGQYRLLKAISTPEKNFCVIGDPDQSIYGFRGSDVQYFDRFLEDFPNAKIVNLTCNYRSTETILEASHQVIRNNYVSTSGLRVYSGIHGVQTITVFEAVSEKAEAVFVGKTIEEHIGGTGFHSLDFGKIYDDGPPITRGFSDFAVLYRTGRQCEVIIDAFEKAGIPYQTVSREIAYGQKEMKAIISFLRVVEGKGSYADIEQLINRTAVRISKKSMELFKTWAYKKSFVLQEALLKAKQLPIPGMDHEGQRRFNNFVSALYAIKKAIEGIAVDKKLLYLAENTTINPSVQYNLKQMELLDHLVSYARKFEERPPDFFSDLALQTDTDIYDSHAEKVALMTMHTAKGLEFPVVFITGCETDYIPFKKSESEIIDVNEERRLFYVAMTRAMERLYLSYAKKRKIFGRPMIRKMSPFLDEIEKKLKNHERSFGSQKKKTGQAQLNLF